MNFANSTYQLQSMRNCFFEDLRVVLVKNCLLFVDFCLAELRIAFFHILWHFHCFHSLQNEIGLCFWVNLFSLGCFFGFASLFLWVTYLLVFALLNFSIKPILGLFSIKLPNLFLHVKFTCLFLQNNLASLSVCGGGMPCCRNREDASRNT